MKETFRERIERELKAMIKDQKQVDRHINEDVNAGNLGEAAINQIKRDTLTMGISRLGEALSQHYR